MQELFIRGLIGNPRQMRLILQVKDSDPECYLTITIGPAETTAIAVKLQDIAVSRPLTHDVLNSAIGVCGGTLERIVISGLKDDTFYAKLVLRHNDTTKEIDCRPSDAIALAIRTQSPIYAENAVIEQAGVQADPETGELVPLNRETTDEGQRPVTEEERKGASAFVDFIDTMDIEDPQKSP